MQRLPQDLVTQSVRPARASASGQLQLALAADLARRWSPLLALLGPLGRLAAHLQVHVGRRRASRLLLLTFVFGTDVNGARLTPLDRADHRAAVRAAQGDPGGLPRRLPVGEPLAARRGEHPASGPLRLPPIPYLAPMVAMWAIALGIVVVQRDLGAALLFFAVFLALLFVATGRVSLRHRRAGPVPRRLVRPVPPVRPRPGSAWTTGSTRGRDPLGRGLPDRPGAVRLRAGRAPGRGPGRRAADDRRAACPCPPSTPTTRSPRWARSWASIGLLAILGLYLVVVERGPADRGRRPGRLPGAAGGRARARDRDPGVHHRGRATSS